MGKHTNGRFINVNPAISKEVAAGATLLNQNGQGGEEGEECNGGIKAGKQYPSALLLKPPGNPPPKTRIANASYTLNSQ